MKKILSLFILLLTFSLTALCVDFSDVSENSWYKGYIDTALEKGYVNGVGDGRFDPDGEFTVAQCLAIASRIHANGKEIPQKSGAWYQSYIDYCIQNAIIKEGEFDSYTRRITREETSRVFYASAPKDNLKPINNIKGIADVAPDDEEYGEVLALYNAGILAGSDSAGVFLPKSYIKRSEIAAMCARIADESLRVKKTLPYYGDARYLIDDIIMYGPNNGVMSGWRVDNKYQTGNETGTDSSTISADYGQKNALYRPINAVSDGKLRLDVMATLVMVENGAYISVDNEKNESVIKIYVANGKIVIYGENKETPTQVAVNPDKSEHAVTFDLDFESKTASVTVDGETVRDIAFSAENAVRVSVGFDGSGRGAITLGFVRCVADYRINENFLSTEKNEGTNLYGNWQTEGNVTIRQMLSERGEDVHSARMDGKSSASHSFEQIGGKVCLEANILLPNKNANITLGTDAFSIYTQDGAYYYNNTYLRHVAENVWTNVRFEMDFAVKEAFVRINGKDCGTHKISGDISSLCKVFFENGDGEMWFDDVKVFSLYDRDDYPSQPLAVNRDGYEIGVNVCNLWRNGNCGEGYDAVAPFGELYPYVGLADEGLPELADWEIKQMAEHGIDFQHICWYSPQSVTTSPIKGTQIPQIALNDGYMKSKYGEYVKFCIMWENGNGSVENEEQFKKFIWPYFKEYYLSDPRYYSIDNKAVITIWNREQLINSFGNVYKVKEIIDFMKEDVKTLGYDGLLVWFSGDSTISSIIKDFGADGVYAYNFGRTGEYADYQIGTMKNNKSRDGVYYIPSVSVGFNAIGRHDERSGMITPAEHRRVCEYIRDEYIPADNNGSWYDNLFIVSTWNEYTEGTYVSPNNLYGFEYLDNIREVFTDAPKEHEDVMPSENVKDRLRNIYPDGFSPIRRLKLEDGREEFDPSKATPVITWDFSETEAKNLFTVGHGLDFFGYGETTIYGSSDARDFSFASKSHMPLNIDIKQTGAKYLHIRMKSDCVSRGELFFTTNRTPAYTAEASAGWTIVSLGEFVDYYVDMTQCNLWNGVLTGIRIDPMANPGSFEVELIEFLAEDMSSSSKILFDGNEMRFDFMPEYDEELDDYMVTLNPRLGFFTMSHTYYEYNVDIRKFYIESLGGCILFTENSDKVLANGKEKNVDFVFTFRDGLPYVPIKWLMNTLGFKVSEKNGVLDFETMDEALKKSLGEIKEGEWNFNNFGNTEGFTFQNCKGYVYDGAFNLETTGKDTAVKNMNLDIEIGDYKKVVVGVKYKTDATNPTAQIFFQTKSIGQMNEKDSKKVTLTTNNTGDEFVELIFDFSDNENWQGILTGLRFDPFHGLGMYSVDYIRLE